MEGKSKGRSKGKVVISSEVGDCVLLRVDNVHFSLRKAGPKTCSLSSRLREGLCTA